MRRVYPIAGILLAGLALVARPAAALPELTPPVAPPPAAPGSACKLSYTIAWDPAVDHVAVLAPELPTIDWGEASVARSEAASADGKTSVTLCLSIKTDDPGTYTWPALRVPYVELDAGAAPGALKTDTVQVLEAASIPIAFAAPRRWGLIGLALAALAGVAAMAAVYPVWRRHAAKPRSRTLDVGEAVQALLHESRRHRLDGDFYAYYKTLTRAATLLGLTKLVTRLEERTQSVGYRGVRPIDDDMDGDLRAVEQALAGRREENPA